MQASRSIPWICSPVYSISLWHPVPAVPPVESHPLHCTDNNYTHRQISCCPPKKHWLLLPSISSCLIESGRKILKLWKFSLLLNVFLLYLARIKSIEKRSFHSFSAFHNTYNKRADNFLCLPLCLFIIMLNLLH